MEHIAIRHVATPAQRDNLRTLAGYLESLPADYDRFRMHTFQARFLNDPDSTVEHVFQPQPLECGSVGCAVGHGPNAGVPWDGYHDWLAYATGEFGDGYEWCFSGSWSAFDNTALGAAKRIRYMLANGLPNASVLEIQTEFWEWYEKEVIGATQLEHYKQGS